MSLFNYLIIKEFIKLYWVFYFSIIFFVFIPANKFVLELGQACAQGEYSGLISERLPIVFLPGENTLFHANAVKKTSRI